MIASVEIVPETEKASTPQTHSDTKDDITPRLASDAYRAPIDVQPLETRKQTEDGGASGTRPIAGLPDSATGDSADAMSESSAPVREQDGQVQVGRNGQKSSHATRPEDREAGEMVPQIRGYGTALPSLDAKKMQSLRTSLLKFGQKYPILVDRGRRVIDGRHRLTILEDLGITPWVVVIDVEDELANEALCLSLDRHRREVSDKATAVQIREHQFANLLALREKDPKTWTQEVIADLMDISPSTVSNWQNKRHILTGGTASKSDGRRQYTDEQKAEAVRLVREENKTVAQVAYEQVMSERGVRRALAEADRKAAAAADSREEPNVEDGDTSAAPSRPAASPASNAGAAIHEVHRTGKLVNPLTDEVDHLAKRVADSHGWNLAGYEDEVAQLHDEATTDFKDAEHDLKSGADREDDLLRGFLLQLHYHRKWQSLLLEGIHELLKKVNA
jgi:ParB-like chromosome segregation protein Spo0J